MAAKKTATKKFAKVTPTKKTSAAKPKQKQEYDDSNRGVLFVNDKDGNDARPDFTGNLALRVDDYETDSDGLVHVRLAAWKKDSEKVGEYLSLSASPPREAE